MGVSIVDNKLETNLFSKPTDFHRLLHFNFAHPFYNKKSIVYSKGLRIKRLCSSPLTFQKHSENLKTCFCNRRYPQKVVDTQIKRVSEKSLDELFERPNRKETRVPLVVKYHPRFHNLSAIIRKYFRFLHAKDKVNGVFIPAPFVTFRSRYSLRKHLVRVKMYPLVRKKVTFCFGKSRSETCCNVKQTDTFESFVTKKVYKLNHSFNCDSKCLIYLFYVRFVVFSM